MSDDRNPPCHPVLSRRRALAKAAPTLEQAAFSRAVEGWDEPVMHGGKVVGTRRRYSDSLLRMLIQRGFGPDGGPEGGGPKTQAQLDEAARAAAEAAGGSYGSAQDEAEARAELSAKLEEMHQRLCHSDGSVCDPPNPCGLRA